jgi:photosystem II stability/assembly factor-like uncharacterized protein
MFGDFSYTSVRALIVYRDGSILAGTGRGLYRSTDHGENWQAVTEYAFDGSSAHSTGVVDIVVAPSGTLLAESNLGVMRSLDSGRTWHTTKSGVNLDLIRVLVHPSGTLYVPTRGHLNRSTDDGASWERIADYEVAIVAFGITANGTVLAFRNSDLLRSTDFGTTWDVVNVDQFVSHYHVLQAYPPDELLLGTNQGLYRSRDDGRTWTSLNDNLFASNIFSLAADSVGALFALAQYQGIFRSTNGAATWTNTGPPGGGVQIPHYSMTQVASGGNGHVYALGLDSMYISSDNGDSWRIPRFQSPIRAAGDILTAPDGLLITEFGTASTLIRSRNYGSAWQLLDSGLSGSRFQYQMPHNGHLFIGGSSGILFSLDTGTSWQRRSNDRPNRAVTYALGQTQSGSLLAATEFGLYRTGNEGVTWDTLGKPFRMDSVIRFTTLHNGRVFATVPPRLYYSDNDGTTWTAIDSSGMVLSGIIQSSTGDVYIGTIGQGLFRLSNTTGVAEYGSETNVTSIQSASQSRDGAGIVLAYSIATSESIRVDVFNISGKQVAGTSLGPRGVGQHEDFIPISSFPSGLYICRLHTQTVTVSRSLVIMR